MDCQYQTDKGDSTSRRKENDYYVKYRLFRSVESEGSLDRGFPICRKESEDWDRESQEEYNDTCAL